MQPLLSNSKVFLLTNLHKHKKSMAYSEHTLTNFYPRNAITRRTPCGSVIDLIIQIQEEHGMPSNKHYEIPFERGYVVLFPSSYLVNNRQKAE